MKEKMIKEREKQQRYFSETLILEKFFYYDAEDKI